MPLPDYAAGFVSRVKLGDGDLLDRLIADVREQTGTPLKRADFKLETLPAHHFMNFKVIDEHGRQLDMGRNLAQLRAELGGRAQQTFQSIAAKDAAVAGAQDGAKPAKSSKGDAPSNAALYSGLTTWNFGALPELLEIRKGNQTLFGYPALVDAGDHCDVEVFDDPAEAARIHRLGLRRLFAIQLREPLKYLEKNIPGLSQMAIQFMSLGTQDELRNQILDATLERACLQDPLPTDDASFGARKDESRARLTLLAQEIARLVGAILAEYAHLPRKLQIAKPFAAAYADIDAQLKVLMHKRFIEATPYAQLDAFSALPQGHRPAHRQAQGGSHARHAAHARDGPAHPAIPARREGAARARAGRHRPAHGRVPLDAGGVAHRLVRAGIAHARADVGQAAAEGMGVDAAVARLCIVLRAESSHFLF